jgi:HD-GYP domain-containing protein (c-di-GMP phosphodiesterase class II)
VSQRPAPEAAIRRLVQAGGTQFDPLVVRCFLSFAESETDSVFATAGTSTAAAR